MNPWTMGALGILAGIPVAGFIGWLGIAALDRKQKRLMKEFDDWTKGYGKDS